MAFFTAARMAKLQALDESAMPGTAGIVRVSPGTVNPDGSSEPGTTTGWNYACRFVSQSQMEQVFGQRMTEEADAALSVPLSSDVLVTDTITYNGNTYQIIGTNAGQSYATSLMLTLRLVK